ncbi:MAG: hypothetical protein ACSHX0_13375 [Akkermansiaceae bacterium]
MSHDITVNRLRVLLTQQGRRHSPSSIRRIARWVCSAYKLELRSPPWQEAGSPLVASPPVSRAAIFSDSSRLNMLSQSYCEV